MRSGTHPSFSTRFMKSRTSYRKSRREDQGPIRPTSGQLRFARSGRLLGPYGPQLAGPVTAISRSGPAPLPPQHAEAGIELHLHWRYFGTKRAFTGGYGRRETTNPKGLGGGATGLEPGTSCVWTSSRGQRPPCPFSTLGNAFKQSAEIGLRLATA